jgi:hypothetical protein
MRGGSWNNDADNCRSAYRNNGNPSNRNNNRGFRLSSTDHRPTGVVHGLRPCATGLSNPVEPVPVHAGQKSPGSPVSGSHSKGRRGFPLSIGFLFCKCRFE